MSEYSVLGIDPGTAATGYGIVTLKQGRLAPIDYGCIRPGSAQRLSQKYLIIYNAITHLLDLHQPDAVSVETQYVSKNVQSAMKLGMARGIVLLAAAQREIAVFEYSPSRAKKAVVGNGRASKEQVQKMMQHLLSLTELPTPEDAADALALSVCHIYGAQRTLNTTQEI